MAGLDREFITGRNPSNVNPSESDGASRSSRIKHCIEDSGSEGSGLNVVSSMSESEANRVQATAQSVDLVARSSEALRLLVADSISLG